MPLEDEDPIRLKLFQGEVVVQNQAESRHFALQVLNKTKTTTMMMILLLRREVTLNSPL